MLYVSRHNKNKEKLFCKYLSVEGKFRDGVNMSEQKLFFVDLIIKASLTPQELFTLYIARVLLLYPAHLCIQRLGGELGKHCTKDRVPGEWLTNNEQRAGEQGGGGREEGKERGDSLAHTHSRRRIKEAVWHASTVYSSRLQPQSIT